MKVWEILVPTKFEDNQKPVRTRHHRIWDEYVLNITGGQTIFRPTTIGRWVENGIVYEDRTIPVKIACSESEIEQIMKFTKKHYRQKAIMAYEISNKVKII